MILPIWEMATETEIQKTILRAETANSNLIKYVEYLTFHFGY